MTIDEILRRARKTMNDEWQTRVEPPLEVTHKSTGSNAEISALDQKLNLVFVTKLAGDNASSWYDPAFFTSRKKTRRK